MHIFVSNKILYSELSSKAIMVYVALKFQLISNVHENIVCTNSHQISYYLTKCVNPSRKFEQAINDGLSELINSNLISLVDKSTKCLVLDCNNIYSDSTFVKLYYDELSTIMSDPLGRNLLRYFLILISTINGKSGNKPQNYLSKLSGLSTRTLTTYNSIISELNLIHFEHSVKHKTEFGITQSSTVYKRCRK